MNKKILYIDMDGVLVDLDHGIELWKKSYPESVSKYTGRFDLIPDIFKTSLPTHGAVDAINVLNESNKYDMFIATSSPWDNPPALTDKRNWIETYFGSIFKKKFITTHRKDLLVGDYLIDDRLKNGAGEFKGELLRFGVDWENNYSVNEYPDWGAILNKLL